MTMRGIQVALFFFFLSGFMLSQEDLLRQIDLDWKYQPNTESRWSYSLGSVYRSTYYSSGKFDRTTSFLQLHASPKYAINSHHAVSLEFRYRIRKLFHSYLVDEKRITQQYNHSHKLKNVNLNGRLKIEQRFRRRFSLRNRYRLGISFLLNKNINSLKEWSLIVDTEALWSVVPNERSTIDQRFTITLKKPISKMLDITIRPQYRYLDYTYNAHGIWHIYTILSVTL